MSFSDLARRWNTNKMTVSRFIGNLSQFSLGVTQVLHQNGYLTICKSNDCKGSSNCHCYASVTEAERSPYPPAPPLSPKDINNLCVNNAHARERIAWEERRELGFREQFKAEGRLMASARKMGCDNLGISAYLERFMDHCKSSDLGHSNIGHFGSHFNKFVEAEKSRPLHPSGSDSTLDWNARIAHELGLIN